MRTALASLVVAIALACALLATERPYEAHAQGKGKGGGPVRCTIDKATGVNFGSYDPEARHEGSSTGDLNFTCQPNDRLTVQVTIGPSTVSGSIAERRMRELGGSDELRYNLFQDRRGTVIWGDGVNGGSPAFVTGSRTFRVEIFGVMPAGQEVSAGIYADLLRITILP